MSGVPWTTAEHAKLVQLYPTHTAAEVAGALGRSVKSVNARIYKHRAVKHHRTIIDGALDAAIRRYNDAGYSDSEAAPLVGCERHTLTKRRKALGLPSHARGTRYRAKVSEASARQAERLGLACISDLRSYTFRRFARSLGWPEDLRPREVQILEALHGLGLATRRQIAESIGLNFPCVKHAFKTRGPGGSYLAELQHRDLVARVTRIKIGYRSTCWLYALTSSALERIAARETCQPADARP